MNPTETILLTALVNIIITGLISGVAVYRIQKGIDNSYAKQMKEFEAKLQYSNFEQQAKFTNIHPKRIETLEILCKKLALCAKSFNELATVARLLFEASETQTIIEASDYEEVSTMIDDFRETLDANRLYLTTIIYVRINSIHSKAQYYCVTLSLLLPCFHFDETRWETIKMMCDKQDFYREIDWDHPNYPDVISNLSMAMDKEVTKLEYLYKSLVDLSYDDKKFDENDIDIFFK